MDSVINHCKMTAAIKKAGIDAESLQEEILTRVGQLAKEAVEPQTKKTPIHKLPGVELIAKVIAWDVIKQSAEKVCGDFGINLDKLSEHAGSTHISSC